MLGTLCTSREVRRWCLQALCLSSPHEERAVQLALLGTGHAQVVQRLGVPRRQRQRALVRSKALGHPACSAGSEAGPA